LDPACKSGVFLREIAKRLIAGLAEKIPDLQERLDHIFKRQIFGVATTELCSLLSRRSVYCSKYPNCKYSVVRFDTPTGNIDYRRMEHVWVGDRCKLCGASRGEYDRDASLETYAYEFIHLDDASELLNMKFDVIVSNPPYQLSDGGNGASAKPLYHTFVEQAKKLNPRYIAMIIPARWYSGGKGLDGFRSAMLNDNRIKELVDYTNSSDCFPGVDVAGGVCYFLWDRDYAGACRYTSNYNGKSTTITKRLNEYDTFIRYPIADGIIDKVTSRRETTMDTMVTTRKPFGLATNAKPMKTGDLTLRYNKGTGRYSRDAVPSGQEYIDKWKVMLSYLTAEHAGQPDKNGQFKVLSTMEILPPRYVCTETYLLAGWFDTEDGANNLMSYLKTRFARFLVGQIAVSQHITKGCFAFVPVQDFSKPWTDEELYAKYGLTDEEVSFIESMIKPMEVDGGNDAV
jgi:site-specific DNA-methyltransferase (adenine-specific)